MPSINDGKSRAAKKADRFGSEARADWKIALSTGTAILCQEVWNRYKAIICDFEAYFRELVPYVHLNPLRARLVNGLGGLAAYKWCGHRAAIGGCDDGILDRDALLEYFGDSEGEALTKYRQIIGEKAVVPMQRDLPGGVLNAQTDRKIFSNQRILGEVDFVENVLRRAGEAMKKEKKSRAEVLAAVEASTGISRDNILRRTREHGPAAARAVYCYLCREESGGSLSELPKELGLTQSAVSKLASKGRLLAKRMKIVI